MPDRETEDLHVDQVRRELAERRRAEESDDATEERTHDRRAERAAYLREKLAERAESEDH